MVGTLLCREYYTEKCVMNNYFGIGLDAKISLDFNNKRDEHPEKCRWVGPHGRSPAPSCPPVSLQLVGGVWSRWGKGRAEC